MSGSKRRAATPGSLNAGSASAIANLLESHGAQIEWLAGLLEGEGYFGMVRHHAKGKILRYPRVGVSMTDLDVIQRIAAIWGVRVYHRKHGAQKDSHRVTIQGKRAVSWMCLLFPLMGERRREQIEKALSEWEARYASARRSKSLAEAAAKQMRLADGTFFPSLRDATPRINRKLSEPIVAAIKGLLEAGALQRDLADAFGICKSSMSSIARNETWSYVEPARVGDMQMNAPGPETTNRLEHNAEILGTRREETILRMKRQSKQSESIRRELAALEQRRLVLEKLLAAYDDLEAFEDQSRKTRQNAPQGIRSLRGAVLQVLSEAEGPLKPKEIWARAQALGAATRADNPVQIVDLAAYQLRSSGVPVEKNELGWFGDPDVLKACLESLFSNSK